MPHLRDLPLRYKLLSTHLALLALVVVLVGGVTYARVRRTLEASIESELKNATTAVRDLVETSVTGSIRSYLRAVTERNLEILAGLYDRYRRGEIDEVTARQRAEEVILAQRIGRDGYVCCLDSTGVVVVHPKAQLVGANLSEHRFVRELMDRRQGYLEYAWQNPGEPAPRPKAMMMGYFAPWDWIVIVSAYREEFARLVDVDDFRDSILALRFGRTGYAYVLDAGGRAIIHPRDEGARVTDAPAGFFDVMRRRASGRVRYAWQNPGEPEPREKLVFFDHVPELGWIVASSSYLDEVYAPLNRVRTLFAVTVALALVLALPLTFRVCSSVTRPLRDLADGLAAGGSGDFSRRLPVTSADEVGRLAGYFNGFMERLDTYAARLRRSEARYRTVMEAAPDPVVVYDLEGRVEYLNPAFERVFGWRLDECRGRRLDPFVPDDCWPETRAGIAKILAGETLSAVETRRLTRDGRERRVSISGAPYRDPDAGLAGSVMILRDVTEARRLERQVTEGADRERQRIGRELHDDLAPHLIGIEVLATVLERRAGEGAGRIRTLIGDAIAKTRALARGLCPVHLVDHGLEVALAELCRDMSEIHGVPCRFEAGEGVEVADNAAATQLFYVAREAVMNAVRHAGARQIVVSLSRSVEGVRLAVADDGCGFDPGGDDGGMGLRIMGFRAGAIGATLVVDSRPGSGSRIAVVLPEGGPS